MVLTYKTQLFDGGSETALTAVSRAGSYAWSSGMVFAAVAASLALERAIPDKERGWLRSGFRSSMPEVVRERRAMDYATEVRPRLGISVDGWAAYLVVIGWLQHLNREEQKILVLRARGRPWAAIARKVGLSRFAAKRRLDKALRRLATGLNDGTI